MISLLFFSTNVANWPPILSDAIALAAEVRSVVFIFIEPFRSMANERLFPTLSVVKELAAAVLSIAAKSDENPC
jgi:hypothetical protein